MNIIGNIFGEVCKTLFPIPEEVYLGNSKSSISICTLSSIHLLKDIANSQLMNNIALVGRLLSENKGIDSIIRYINSNPTIKTIILCGHEVLGHKPGDSLLSLHKYGVDSTSRIINSSSPDPVLSVLPNEIKKFRNTIQVINKIGVTDLKEITNLVQSIKD